MPDATKGSGLTLADLWRAQAADYGPLEAGLIGAGAAAQSGIDQAHQAYLLARLGLANRWQGEEAANAIRVRIGDLLRERGDNGKLYQPLREARPYSTGIGEAIPAYTLGRAAGSSALRWNVGTAALEDLAPTVGRMLATRGF